jgi:hypothetical protein
MKCRWYLASFGMRVEPEKKGEDAVVACKKGTIPAFPWKERKKEHKTAGQSV